MKCRNLGEVGKSLNFVRMRKVVPWAPKAENVALAQGIICILGAQNAKMEKMTEFNEI